MYSWAYKGGIVCVEEMDYIGLHWIGLEIGGLYNLYCSRLIYLLIC